MYLLQNCKFLSRKKAVFPCVVRRKLCEEEPAAISVAIVVGFMRRSNRNFNIPPRPGKPRAFDHPLCPESREFDLQGLPGGWDLTFAWVWWGKLNRKCEMSGFFFFSGAEVANVFRRVGIN